MSGEDTSINFSYTTTVNGKDVKEMKSINIQQGMRIIVDGKRYEMTAGGLFEIKENGEKVNEKPITLIDTSKENVGALVGIANFDKTDGKGLNITDADWVLATERSSEAGNKRTLIINMAENNIGSNSHTHYRDGEWLNQQDLKTREFNVILKDDNNGQHSHVGVAKSKEAQAAWDKEHYVKAFFRDMFK